MPLGYVLVMLPKSYSCAGPYGPIGGPVGAPACFSLDMASPVAPPPLQSPVTIRFSHCASANQLCSLGP